MITKNWIRAVAVAIAITVVGRAQASVIILDTFTDSDGTQLEGRAPDTTNLPGGVWNRANTFWGSSIQGNAFQMGPDNGWTVPLASFGPYTRPNQLTISADLAVQDMDNGSGNGGGVGIGFNSILGGGSNPHGSFTGLRLDQFGTLTFRTGVADSPGDVASVPWSGPAFNSSDYYHLSYEVNTSTGAISNIVLQNSTADYSSLVTAAAGYFTSPNTDYAYFYGNSGSGGSTALIDNFMVEGASAVPEPPTFVLAALGLVGLGCVPLRKKYRRAAA